MEIRPLRGYRYAGSVAREISAVVAPPYDQISPETQDRLYAMSPHNIVRVTYPKDAADKYRDARDALDADRFVGRRVLRRLVDGRIPFCRGFPIVLERYENEAAVTQINPVVSVQPHCR